MRRRSGGQERFELIDLPEIAVAPLKVDSVLLDYIEAYAAQRAENNE
jgi:hypothetical protein